MQRTVSGRALRRDEMRAARLKGPGFTRSWRKGRTNRLTERKRAAREAAEREAEATS